jgi:hypothetical protein
MYPLKTPLLQFWFSIVVGAVVAALAGTSFDVVKSKVEGNSVVE